MRNRLGFVAQRIGVMMAQGPGTEVVITWTEFAAGVAVDPVTGAMVVGEQTGVSRQVKVQGFVHFVQPGTSAVRLFNEVEVGDVIVDLPGDFEFELAGVNRMGFRFFIEGEEYAQKVVSDRLARSWDAVVQGVKLSRPVLLRKAT